MASSITISRGHIVDPPDQDGEIYLLIDDGDGEHYGEQGTYLTKADLEAMLKLFDEPEKESKK